MRDTATYAITLIGTLDREHRPDGYCERRDIEPKERCPWCEAIVHIERLDSRWARMFFKIQELEDVLDRQRAMLQTVADALEPLARGGGYKQARRLKRAVTGLISDEGVKEQVRRYRTRRLESSHTTNRR